jgi:exodeoxyribonuclease VII large subunit|tara:strand:- start:3558 stop:4988 length:1431 start_codon:yes stop_codon:yes gene_type:complete
VAETSTFRPADREVLSVSELNRLVKRLLEDQFPLLLVEGEISNFARPSSGHWYFTLKDASAQVRCAMFRNRNRQIRFVPEDGMQVLLHGRVGLYEGRGEFQLICESMEEAGDGALRRAFDRLKQKLAAEGLFAAELKQELPVLPDHVAIITSPTGAAVRDMLTVLKRRFPAIPITVIPVQVQGDQAAAQIVRAIRLANRYQTEPFDLLVLTRGGGSLEDLWPFNEEIVARAIADSQLPIVSAVGHEIDFSIADLVADLRAATPSAAAEMISPDQDEWQQLLQGYHNLFAAEITRRLQSMVERTANLRKRIRHPGQRLQDQAQRLDDVEIRLTNTITYRLSQSLAKVDVLTSRIAHPKHKISTARLTLQNLMVRFRSRSEDFLKSRSQQLASIAQQLHALSPLATLNRGYAIVTTDSEAILKDARAVGVGDRISARLSRGKLRAIVDETIDAIDDGDSSGDDGDSATDDPAAKDVDQ